jgi:hypothetical protein
MPFSINQNRFIIEVECEKRSIEIEIEVPLDKVTITQKAYINIGHIEPYCPGWDEPKGRPFMDVLQELHNKIRTLEGGK